MYYMHTYTISNSFERMNPFFSNSPSKANIDNYSYVTSIYCLEILSGKEFFIFCSKSSEQLTIDF